MENNIKNVTDDGYEICVLCGKVTDVKFTTPVDYRYHYIEGAGQLCKSCYNRGTERRQIIIPADLVYNTPNDMELGEKVRQIYNSNL